MEGANWGVSREGVMEGCLGQGEGQRAVMGWCREEEMGRGAEVQGRGGEAVIGVGRCRKGGAGPWATGHP